LRPVSANPATHSRADRSQRIGRQLRKRLSNFFPAVVIEPATVHSPAEIRANLSGTAETYLDAIAAPRPDLFFHALATMHTPTYRQKAPGVARRLAPHSPPRHSRPTRPLGQPWRRLAELLDANPASTLPPSGPSSPPSNCRRPKLDEASKLTAGWATRARETPLCRTSLAPNAPGPKPNAKTRRPRSAHSPPCKKPSPSSAKPA